MIAPDKHRAEANKFDKEIIRENFPTIIENKGIALKPTIPKIAPNKPKPEPVKVKMQRVLKKFDLLFSIILNLV